MRKGFDGLAVLVQDHLKRDPFSGQAFVFRGRQGRLVKMLWWAEGARGSVQRSWMEWRLKGGQGYCLFAKRLEKGRFLWPAAAQGAAAALTPAQVAMLLEGGASLRLRQAKPVGEAGGGIDWRAPVRTDQPRLAG